MSPMKCLEWAVVSFVFWMALVVFRLGSATDVQDVVMWWLTLPFAFGFPAFFGYNIAKWRFYRKVHSIGVREASKDMSCD